jgi:predicted metal-binding membrane protein
VLAGLVLTAWLALWLWGSSPSARYLGHSGQRPATDGWLELALFLAGWTLMVIAVMLPTATQLLRAFAGVVRNRPRRGLLEGLLVAGFLGAWLLVGYLFRVADLGLHGLVASVGWLQVHTRLLGAGALVLAGVYQLTPLKRRCLTACRSPRGFIYRGWQGRSAAGDAVRIGFAYGWSCVGCCWALMLVMFALGLGSLAWMLGVGALMAVEKGTAAGQRLSWPIGLALAATGIAVALNVWPPPA